MNEAERVLAQIELEKNITERSIRDYQREYQKTVDRGGVGSPETKLISFSLDSYVKAIEHYLETYSLGKVVKRPQAAIKLTELKEILSLYQIAFIAAQQIFCTITQKSNGQKIAKRISTSIEQEEKLKQYKKYNTKYYETVMKELNSRNARVDWKVTNLNHSFNKKFEYRVSTWKPGYNMQVGLILLELFIQATGYVEWKMIWEKGKSKNYVVATKETLEWIEKENTRLEVLNPTFLPMICPPKDWTGVYDGGYISPYIAKARLMKHYDKDYLKKLDSAEMPEVFSAINTLQATSWSVNQKVLDVVKRLWEENKCIGGIPNRNDIEPPAFPYPGLGKEDYRSDEMKAVIRSWKNEAVANYRANVQIRSVRLLTAQIIRIANQFSSYDKIWFPYQLDFRGRLYPIPVMFQPQGNDLAKGLLRFGEGKPLDTEDAVNWLRIHGANTYGVDKVSYEERVKWVKENEESIKSYAENPTENTGWCEADKPFQFLAFCLEYNGYLSTGYGYMSCLPIYTDGTNNGLQHYSALLRDEEAGKSVNLVDSEQPSDIYRVVADKLTEKLNELLWTRNTSENNRTDKDYASELSSQFITLGINRKLTKRPVMVLPYGGTKMSCRGYIEEYLLDNYSLSFLHEHFGKIGKEPTQTVFKATQWLSNLLWESIGETLRAAIVGMDYIRKKLTGHKKEAIEWLTPCGLLISQKYPNKRMIEVKTELFGSIKRWEVMANKSGVNPHKQTNGICPNFIHSLDAAALMKYINKASLQGIKSFGAVHDSYGTLAADVTLMQKLLREAFMDIYRIDEQEGKCILEKFIEDITGEPATDLPAKGSLNIQDVLESKYFFN